MRYRGAVIGTLVLQVQLAVQLTNEKDISASARLAGGVTMNRVMPSLAYISTFNKSDPGGTLEHCAGAIIADSWVVTAALCVVGWDGQRLVDSGSVLAGSKNREVTDPPAQLVGVSRFVVHENYHTNARDNDVALLLVKPAFKLDGINVAAIPLPKASLVARDLMAGKVSVNLFGWGSETTTGEAAVRTQIVLNMPVTNQAECAKQVARRPYYYKLPSTAFCANVTGSNGVCEGGDAGAIAVAEFTSGKEKLQFLVGVASWWVGNQCPTLVPNTFTRVAEFAKWIQKQGGPVAP